MVSNNHVLSQSAHRSSIYQRRIIVLKCKLICINMINNVLIHISNK